MNYTVTATVWVFVDNPDDAEVALAFRGDLFVAEEAIVERIALRRIEEGRIDDIEITDIIEG